MRLRSLVPVRATRLLDALERVLDHLRGRNRIDFRRLFLATTKGTKCWELDRWKVTPKAPQHELSDRRDGFWLPAWTWPIITDLFRHDHLLKVKAGDESRIESVLMTPGARKDGELLDPSRILEMRDALMRGLSEYVMREKKRHES